MRLTFWIEDFVSVGEGVSMITAAANSGGGLHEKRTTFMRSYI
jgi:hypothetical protein